MRRDPPLSPLRHAGGTALPVASTHIAAYCPFLLLLMFVWVPLQATADRLLFPADSPAACNATNPCGACTDYASQVLTAPLASEVLANRGNATWLAAFAQQYGCGAGACGRRQRPCQRLQRQPPLLLLLLPAPAGRGLGRGGGAGLCSSALSWPTLLVQPCLEGWVGGWSP